MTATPARPAPDARAMIVSVGPRVAAMTPGHTRRSACSGLAEHYNSPRQQSRTGVSTMGRRVTIQGKDGPFRAYVADGKTKGGPAIVVIQEIFGVNQVMRDIADSAGRGGLYRGLPGPVLAHRTGHRHHRQDRRRMGEGVQLLQGVQRRQRRRGYRRHHRLGPGAGPRKGRRGGLLPRRPAGLPDGHPHRCDATVSYYGVGIDNYLAEAGQGAGNRRCSTSPRRMASSRRTARRR